MVGAVTLLIQELAGYGAERLADIGVEVPGLKEAGEAWESEQIDAIDRWLGDVSESLETLQHQLEATLKVTARDSWEKIAEAVARAFEDRQEFAAELASVQKRLRQQTLSLHRMCRQLLHAMATVCTFAKARAASPRSPVCSMIVLHREPGIRYTRWATHGGATDSNARRTAPN